MSISRKASSSLGLSPLWQARLLPRPVSSMTGPGPGLPRSKIPHPQASLLYDRPRTRSASSYASSCPGLYSIMTGPGLGLSQAMLPHSQARLLYDRPTTRAVSSYASSSPGPSPLWQAQDQGCLKLYFLIPRPVSSMTGPGPGLSQTKLPHPQACILSRQAQDPGHLKLSFLLPRPVSYHDRPVLSTTGPSPLWQARLLPRTISSTTGRDPC